MDLHALADFNLVAAAGGFGRASRASGRAKATLSRRVAGLERELGVRLIERATRSFRLTDEGRALHERVAGPLAEIAEAGEATVLAAAAPRGRLRISAPVVFAHAVLGPVAARFTRVYPAVRLEIVAEDRKVDPIAENYDLVIRVDPDPDDTLVGRCILRDDRLVVAPSFLVRPDGAPSSKGAAVPAVVLSSSPAELMWTIAASPELHVRAEAVLRLSSLPMVRDAVLAGAGAALLPRLLVANDLAEGRLACWGRLKARPAEVWALQSSRRLVGAKVRAFLDMLGQPFATAP